MKHSTVGNLILDYEDQVKLAVLAACYLKGELAQVGVAAANEFLDWVGDHLAPEED